MDKTKLVFKDTHLADKAAKTPQGRDYCNSHAGGYLWGGLWFLGWDMCTEGGFFGGSKVPFLDLVVVTRLFTWNNSSTHTFFLHGFLYLCSLKKIFFYCWFFVGLICFKDSVIVREEQVNVLHST